MAKRENADFIPKCNFSWLGSAEESSARFVCELSSKKRKTKAWLGCSESFMKRLRPPFHKFSCKTRSCSCSHTHRDSEEFGTSQQIRFSASFEQDNKASRFRYSFEFPFEHNGRLPEHWSLWRISLLRGLDTKKHETNSVIRTFLNNLSVTACSNPGSTR